MPIRPKKPLLRWLAVNAKQIVLLPDVHAEGKKTFHEPVFASARVGVRMMRTPRISMKLMIVMILKLFKDTSVVKTHLLLQKSIKKKPSAYFCQAQWLALIGL